MRIIFVLILFIVQQLINADDEQDQWSYPEKCSGYGCDYVAKWLYLEKTDEIRFQISTKFRNKWTGIGFSDTKRMNGTDAVIGLVEDNGRYFLMDTYLKDYSAPPLDAVQNIHNMTVWRENGITHLQFHRFRTTSDPNYDFQFTDDHCGYFHFVVRGGVFNAVNKRLRKHEDTPIVSPNKICIRSKDINKRKKITEVPAPRLNVPNKPKIPNRFKARPKLTNLLSTTTTTITTISSIEYKSPESTTTRKPIDQLTTLPVEISVKNDKSDKIDKIIDKEKLIDKSTELISIKPATDFKIKIINTTEPTISSTELSTMNSNENKLNINKLNDNKLDNKVNSNDLNKLNKLSESSKNDDKNEEKNDDKNEEYGDDEETNDKKINLSNTEDGRITTDHETITKNIIKSFNFNLKILTTNLDLNSTLVNQEAEKELNDLYGFKQLKLLTLKSINDSNKDNKIWIADFVMDVQTESNNDTDYLAYLQRELNQTVNNGHIGNLMLDTSHYSLLKQDSNSIKQPEAKYIFEYNFYNQFTIKLTNEQLKLAYIILGVSFLVLLVLMQACCMCCTSSDSKNDLHNKQNNLSNSSTLQDKHQLNIHHHQYNDYIKNCGGGNYSYENFALDADGYDMANSSYKMKQYKHSLSKHDPMIYHHHHPQNNYSNSYRRQQEWNNQQQFNHNHYHHNHGSHLRYYEPQPMTTLEPDFYFMPHQRINHKCYN